MSHPYLLSDYHVPGSGLGTEDSAMTRTRDSEFWGWHCGKAKTNKKQDKQKCILDEDRTKTRPGDLTQLNEKAENRLKRHRYNQQLNQDTEMLLTNPTESRSYPLKRTQATHGMHPTQRVHPLFGCWFGSIEGKIETIN